MEFQPTKHSLTILITSWYAKQAVENGWKCWFSPIFHSKIWNHPVETNIYKWMAIRFQDLQILFAFLPDLEDVFFPSFHCFLWAIICGYSRRNRPFLELPQQTSPGPKTVTPTPNFKNLQNKTTTIPSTHLPSTPAKKKICDSFECDQSPFERGYLLCHAHGAAA